MGYLVILSVAPLVIVLICQMPESTVAWFPVGVVILVVLKRITGGQFDVDLCDFCGKNQSGHRCLARYEEGGIFQPRIRTDKRDWSYGRVVFRECKME